MKQCLALALALAVSAPSWAETRQADPPLIVNGNLSLTTSDFEAYLQKVPEKLRPDFRENIDRVSKTVDGLWVQRVVASKARAAGLDRDPLVVARMRQAQEAVLVEAYLQRMERDMKYPDLRMRAREVYDADPSVFKEPGKVHVQHILIEAKSRPREEAMKRAKEIHADVVAGKEEFTAIARRVSDDPTKDKNGGDLGPVEPSKLDSQFLTALSTLKPGEVSPPFETRFGFHVAKLVKRDPDRVRSFEEVREAIIASEKDKILEVARNQLLADIRNDPKNHVHMENVEALTARPRDATASTARDSKTR